MTKEQILNELRIVENNLSPENLCCDDELPKSLVIPCDHNAMVINDSKSHVWKCAECEYIYI
jgi:hypothetical protein